MRSGKKPERIVSLVPSQTELLFDLGLYEEVVGITKFCVHPDEWYHHKTRIGGTKNIDIEKIQALQPDLILANKEENVQEQVEALRLFCPVYVSNISTFDDAQEMIRQVGMLVHKELKAAELVQNILSEFATLKALDCKLQTCYLIWRKPYMTVGGDTYISDVMELCGFENVFVDEIRYPELTIERMEMENCELVLLSSEPYPFKEAHVTELQKHLPNAKIILVDGEMFSWYGSRLLKAPTYFRQLIAQVST